MTGTKIKIEICKKQFHEDFGHAATFAQANPSCDVFVIPRKITDMCRKYKKVRKELDMLQEKQPSNADFMLHNDCLCLCHQKQVKRDLLVEIQSLMTLYLLAEGYYPPGKYEVQTNSMSVVRLEATVAQKPAVTC